ncbi:MAG: RNA polymerase sigma factor RpoE, partial [Planctomycetes bacterium]|nr:RNA polymerase sigma factor RpoE [Planctomycetota bacterium]
MTDAPTDQELVTEVLNGRQEAFAVLVERHQNRVLGHIQRMIGPRDADDITQDSFIRA